MCTVVLSSMEKWGLRDELIFWFWESHREKEEMEGQALLLQQTPHHLIRIWTLGSRLNKLFCTVTSSMWGRGRVGAVLKGSYSLKCPQC